MDQILKWTKEEQQLIINNTADKLKLSNAIIEKDYWVCFVLDYLFSKFKYKDYICFKGGTSLSKVHNLIHRFSEDIDIALDWTVLGFAEKEPYLNRSKRQQEILNRKINTLTCEFISEKCIPLLISDFNNLLGNNFELFIDQTDPQTICFRYPQMFKDKSILQIIRIEIGALVEAVPSSESTLSSYIAQTYPTIIEKSEITVKTVDPVRTFYEKLLILHREANRVRGQSPQRYSRHFYDVYQMINSFVRVESFEKISLLSKVIEFNNRFYPYSWANYNSIYKGELNLIPNNVALTFFEKDYQNMKNMIFQSPPKFEEIILRLKDFQTEMNMIIIEEVKS